MTKKKLKLIGLTDPGVCYDDVYLYDNPDRSLEPEKHLLAAVINRAIADVINHLPKAGKKMTWRISMLRTAAKPTREQRRDALRRLKRSRAVRWFARRYQDEAPEFSFQWVCEELHIPPQPIRNRLKEIIRSRLSA